MYIFIFRTFNEIHFDKQMLRFILKTFVKQEDRCHKMNEICIETDENMIVHARQTTTAVKKVSKTKGNYCCDGKNDVSAAMASDSAVLIEEAEVTAASEVT